MFILADGLVLLIYSVIKGEVNMFKFIVKRHLSVAEHTKLNYCIFFECFFISAIGIIGVVALLNSLASAGISNFMISMAGVFMLRGLLLFSLLTPFVSCIWSLIRSIKLKKTDVEQGNLGIFNSNLAVIFNVMYLPMFIFLLLLRFID